MSFASFRPVAALVASAILGGVVAVGAVALLGGLDSGTTVVTETSAARSPGLAPASANGMSVNEIYERAASGVVRVNSTSNSTAASGLGSQQTSALGSGFVIDKTGHIVTNYHVVEGADVVTVSFSNRDTVKAEVVGTDPSSDIAVLRVNTSASALTPLPLGNSDAVEVGDPVVAIGNPFGLDRTVTAGHRERSPAPHHGPESLHHRPRHPDRCADQPRQLGRPASLEPRPGHRRQHADRDG